MADATATTGATTTTTDDANGLNIPADVIKKFGDLVEMVKNSRSMDQSERQYWIDVLPIMSDDQIQNLRDILDNEKKQLAEAEATYQEGTKESFLQATKAFDEEVYREKKRVLAAAEAAHEAKETSLEDEILNELDEL